MNGWLGEVEGLQVSLNAAKRKLAGLDRSIQRNQATGTTDLGMPVITASSAGTRPTTAT